MQYTSIPSYNTGSSYDEIQQNAANLRPLSENSTSPNAPDFYRHSHSPKQEEGSTQVSTQVEGINRPAPFASPQRRVVSVVPLANVNSAQPLIKRVLQFNQPPTPAVSIPSVITSALPTSTALTNPVGRKKQRVTVGDITRFIASMINCIITTFICVAIWYVFVYSPEQLGTETNDRIYACSSRFKSMIQRDDFISIWRVHADAKEHEINRESNSFVIETTCSEAWKVGSESGACCERVKAERIQSYARRVEVMQDDILEVIKRIESKTLNRDEKDIWNNVQTLLSSSMEDDLRQKCEIPIIADVMKKHPAVILESYFEVLKNASNGIPWYQTVMLLTACFLLILLFISKPLEIFVDLAFIISTTILGVANICCCCRRK